MRDYTKIKDQSLLTPLEKKKKARNLRIADLAAQGESSSSIVRHILREFDEVVSTQRIAEIVQVMNKKAEKEGLK